MTHTSLDITPPSRQRIQSLTKFQLQCIEHAAKFPSVRRISYSTCSVYKEENEEVVAKALNSLGSAWELEAIAPELGRGGFVVDGLSEAQASCVVRCEKEDEEMGQGFFVCVFTRKDGKREKEGSEAKNRASKVKKMEKVVKKPVLRIVSKSKKRAPKHGKKVPLVK